MSSSFPRLLALLLLLAAPVARADPPSPEDLMPWPPGPDDLVLVHGLLEDLREYLEGDPVEPGEGCSGVTHDVDGQQAVVGVGVDVFDCLPTVNLPFRVCTPPELQACCDALPDCFAYLVEQWGTDQVSNEEPVAFCVGIEDSEVEGQAQGPPYLTADVGKSCSAAPNGT